jgi:hypothetical protein
MSGDALGSPSVQPPRKESQHAAAEEAAEGTPSKRRCRGDYYYSVGLHEELWSSTDHIFQSRLTILLSLGPVAIIGDSLGLLGEPICFALSGLALIPCAER